MPALLLADGAGITSKAKYVRVEPYLGIFRGRLFRQSNAHF